MDNSLLTDKFFLKFNVKIFIHFLFIIYFQMFTLPGMLKEHDETYICGFSRKKKLQSNLKQEASGFLCFFLSSTPDIKMPDNLAQDNRKLL